MHSCKHYYVHNTSEYVEQRTQKYTVPLINGVNNMDIINSIFELVSMLIFSSVDSPVQAELTLLTHTIDPSLSANHSAVSRSNSSLHLWSCIKVGLSGIVTIILIAQYQVVSRASL